MIPEHILQANKKWHEQVEDLFRESKCANKVAMIFGDWTGAGEVQRKIRDKQ